MAYHRLTPEEEAERSHFYEIAAKRFKAELRLYGATAAIHLENKNDEVFWGKVLKHAYPEGKFRFIASSRNQAGNECCGCTQCLQYREFLDENFWVAIDSDYRYLSQEKNINVKHFILQTYTYSFENHFCYAPNMNRALYESVGYKIDFDFEKFLLEYSKAVYPLLVWQLYMNTIDPEIFPLSVFHRLLSLPVPPNFYKNNGQSILSVLQDRARKFITHFRREYPEADITWYEDRCNDLGVNSRNAYLFVRGHNLYDLVEYMGRKLLAKAREDDKSIQTEHSFEYYLTKNICFGEYDEIVNLEDDIKELRSLKLKK